MPNDRPREQLLDLPEGDPLSPEHLDEQVQKAQDELAQLRKRQELIERQKRELEEMSKRQDQFNAGRTEVVDKLTRAVVVLEREKYEAQRRVETLEAIDESFRSHLELLDGIDPKSWEGQDLNKELTRALSAVDDARTEYSKSYPKIASEPAVDYAAAGQSDVYSSEAGGRDFKEWLMMGLAFTLPLIVCLLMLIVVLAKK
jgi:hypothetical protein